MKKIITIMVILLVLFSSCAKDINSESNTTTTEKENISDVIVFNNGETVKFSETQAKTQDQEDKTEHTANETENDVVITTKKRDDNVSEEPPPMSFFTLEQLKKFKNACETMNDDEFIQFLDDSENLNSSFINNREEALSVLNAIESTTIVLLDGEKSNFNEIDYYEKGSTITQPVFMSESRNLVCCYYTNLSENNVKTQHEKLKYIAEVTANGITAEVYLLPNGDVDEFYAEMFVDGTRITYRVTEEQTIEEFEEDFARLEFVKIGDLLEE